MFWQDYYRKCSVALVVTAIIYIESMFTLRRKQLLKTDWTNILKFNLPFPVFARKNNFSVQNLEIFEAAESQFVCFPALTRKNVGNAVY